MVLQGSDLLFPLTTPNCLVHVPVSGSVMSSHGIEGVSPGSSGASLCLHLSPAPRGQLASHGGRNASGALQEGRRKQQSRARLDLGHECYVDIESRR